MARSSKQKEIDITKAGPMNSRQLQEANNEVLLGLSPEFQKFTEDLEQNYAPASLYDARLHAQQDVMSPLSQQQTFSGDQDYWGNSHWDNPSATEAQFSNLSDIRAENQPWYSKLINGIGKAGVLAATTALETAGLLYGVGQGIYNATQGGSFLQGLWDNPITNALQSINEVSEEYMPNYYTQDEQQNPFGNIFTANFLGDKLLKNLGFMVGAFYGGIPASTAIGKLGTRAVKSARNASLAERAGMARRVGELTAQYGDDAAGLERALAREGLTEAERGKRILEGFDKVRNAAQTTRATTQTIGALGSAINEGAIEALNNSKDWARQQTMVANDEYQQTLTSIEQEYGGSEMEDVLKMQAAEDHERKLAEIEKGRARMGNADLLLNIPVLMASNMYQLGKLYTRGFDSTRRQLGSLFNGHRLSGDLAKGTLKSDKTWKGALGTAVLKSNTEGLEEYLQRAASDGAGEAVSNSIERWMDAGSSGEAENNVNDYIAGFGKAIADNLGDPNAWEEYMIGALSSMVGMPVFGSQTKNSYIAKDNGVFGFAGGIVGNYQDYMDARDNEEKVAQYLNQRVKDPKFKALYDNLKKQEDYDKWLQEEIEKGDKSAYKDLELEKFYQDLNAAASSGHLEEFKQMVGYNQDYTDEELEDIVKQTSRKITAEQQRKQDEDRKAYLESQVAEFSGLERALTPEESRIYDDLIYDDLNEVNKRLEEDNYQDKLEGPFIDRNGQMNVTDPDKMREILERNRQNLLEGIDDYLKIRNDIDIETDGRLDDEDISTLTMMKGHILDYEKRSAEMANDLISNLGEVLISQEYWQDKIKQDLEGAQENYNKSKAHWESVKNGKHNKEYKESVEKKLLAAEKKLNKAKAANNSVGNAIKLLQMLTESRDSSARETWNEGKGYGESLGRRLGKLTLQYSRAINSDEAQAILASPQNVITLLSILNSSTSNLDDATRQRLTHDVVDLSALANQKIAYNKKVKEFLGDTSKINEAYQQSQDKISQKEKDNKSDELSLNIKNARNMAELDRVMREAYNINPEIAKAAMDKAKQTSDESTKNFIADYEKATKFYGDFGAQVTKLSPDVVSSIMGTVSSEWEEALQDGVSVYDKFIDGLNLAAEELEKSDTPIAKESAKAMKQILKDLDAAKKGLATSSSPKKSTTSSEKKSGEDKEDTSESVAGEKEGLAALAKKMAEKRAKKEEKKKEKITMPSYFSSMKSQLGEKKSSLDYYLKDAEYRTSRGHVAGGPAFQGTLQPAITLAIDSGILPEDFRDVTKGTHIPYERLVGAVQALKDLGITSPKMLVDVVEKEELPAAIIDTQDSLQKAIEQEIRVNEKIDKEDKLSKALRDRIQKYNEDNPDTPFTFDFEELFQKITDEKIAKDDTNLGSDDLESDNTDLGEDEEGSQRAQDMHDNLRVTFRSDHPTEFRIYDGNTLIEYRVPYTPDTEQLKAVQQLLKDLKAYQFIDKNYLGYIAKAMQGKDKPVTVHLLRSTDDAINSDTTHPITFLAIKWDSTAEKAVRKYGFNGRNDINLSDEVKPVTINGEQYHIIGVMTLNSDVHEDVSKAFAELQGALNQELNPQIQEAKDNGQPFVVSHLTTTVDTINTGRLEKKNSDDDSESKVSLYDFMTYNQEDPKNPATHERRTSTEWSSGMDFYFGTVVNGFLNAVEDDTIRENWEEPNDTWMENNNGAVLLFVPKADGKLYPIRCTRRTVRNWLSSKDADGGRSGQELLEAVMSGEKNEYIGNILGYLKTIYDEEATLADKMNAKMMLQKYFIFGKESPIHFNDGEVTFTGKEEHNLTSDSFEEFVGRFFDALDKENIMFSLPSPSIEDINGRDVIKSGIFEIGLRGFYNFNANFTVRAIDAEGNDITGQVASDTDEHFTGGNNDRREYRDYDLGNGIKRYYIVPDATGTYYTVTDAEGNPVSTDESNIINLIEQKRQGRLPQFQMEMLDARYAKSPEVKKFVANGLEGFQDIYIIHAEEDWVYDARKGDHNARLYKLSSDEGVKLKNDFNKAVNEFASKDENVIAIAKLKKVSGAETAKEKEGLDDPLYSEVVGFLINNEDKRFISSIQRQFKIGYNRAHKMFEAWQSQQNVGNKKLEDYSLDDFINEARDRMPHIDWKFIKGKLLNIRTVANASAIKQVRDILSTYTNADFSASTLFNLFGYNWVEEVGKKMASISSQEASKGTMANVEDNAQQGTLFAGKTLDDLNAKNGGLEGLLAMNAKSPIIKGVPAKNGKPARVGVWEALQAAESVGKPIDQDYVARRIEAIMAADKSEKSSMLDDLVHQIMCG